MHCGSDIIHTTEEINDISIASILGLKSNDKFFLTEFKPYLIMNTTAKGKNLERKIYQGSGNKINYPKALPVVLIPFDILPQELREKLVSLYGSPYSHKSEGENILSEMESLLEFCMKDHKLQNHHQTKNHSHEIDLQLSAESLLLKIASMMKSGNKKDQLPYFSVLYSGYRKRYEKLSCRSVSRNQFYAKLQQISIRYEQIHDKRTLSDGSCKQQ